MITIRFKIPTFSLVEPFLKRGGGCVGSFDKKLKFRDFSIDGKIF